MNSWVNTWLYVVGITPSLRDRTTPFTASSPSTALHSAPPLHVYPLVSHSQEVRPVAEQEGE